MANYSIIINSKFKPFSYAEMLAPVLESTLAHQLVEEAYSALSTLAESIAAKANEQTDPKAYARYKAYAELLLALAENLARNGLTPDSRRSMFRMRDLYAKQILPIQEAIQKRKEMSDLQLRTLMANPTMLFGKKAATTSLDEFLDNPNIDFSQLYSGALLTEQVAKQASALANELTSYGKGKSVDPYTYTFLKRYGFTRAEVLKAISDPNASGSSRVLSAIVDSVLQSSGVPLWADLATMERARAYANQGLWSAIGKADVAPMEDYGARKRLEAALLDRNNARSAARAARASRGGGRHSGGSSGGYSYAVNPNGTPKSPIMPIPTFPSTKRIHGSGAREGRFKNATSVLGISYSKDGKKVMSRPVTITYQNPNNTKTRSVFRGGINGGYVGEVPVSSMTGKYRIFDSKSKRMYSRQTFINQGKSKLERDALSTYWDKLIKPAIATIGGNTLFASNGSGYTLGYIGGKAQSFVNKTRDYDMQVYSMNVGDNNKALSEGAIGRAIQNAGGVYKIKDATFQNKDMTGEKVTIGQLKRLISKKEKEGKALVQFDNVFAKGQEGLIISIDNEQFYLPAKNISSDIARNRYLFNQVNLKTIKDARDVINQYRPIYDEGVYKYGSIDAAIGANPNRYYQAYLALSNASNYLTNVQGANVSEVMSGMFDDYNIQENKYGKDPSLTDNDQYMFDSDDMVNWTFGY